MLHQPIGGWDVSNVEHMWGMFQGARAFHQPIGDWDAPNVAKMELMFHSAATFN